MIKERRRSATDTRDENNTNVDYQLKERTVAEQQVDTKTYLRMRVPAALVNPARVGVYARDD